MPGLIINRGNSSTTTGSIAQGRWLDQQQYLIETYRQIRDNLGEMEEEIEAARLRVTDWNRHRREKSRSRSLSHASISTNTSSHLSCSTFESSCTDASCLHMHRDGAVTGSSCPSSSSCSSACEMTLPAAVAASLNAATLISAFLSASSSTATPCTNTTNQHSDNVPESGHESVKSAGSRVPKRVITKSLHRSNRSASPIY